MGDVPMSSPSSSPTTEAPTRAPSKSPTDAPTSGLSSSPTTEAPTGAPSKSLTGAPTSSMSPTSSPISKQQFDDLKKEDEDLDKELFKCACNVYKDSLARKLRIAEKKEQLDEGKCPSPAPEEAGERGEK